MPATITIELRNLHFFAAHGWHAEEAVLGNEFEVTLLTTFAAQENIASIGDTVDYVLLYNIIRDIFSEPARLLETVAQKITGEIEKHIPGLQHTALTIRKLNPLISHFSGTVGITYSKKF